MNESENDINGNVDENYKKNNNKRKQKEDLSSIIERRNRYLLKFFSLLDLPIRIIGDENSPAMIYNNEIVLNAYVHNFELRFTDSPVSKNVIYTIKLNENPRFDKNRVLLCLSEYKARPVYKVSLNTNPILYLTGYNFLNKDEKLGRYPVFSAYNPKVYFTEDKAKEITSELKMDGYDSKYL